MLKITNMDEQSKTIELVIDGKISREEMRSVYTQIEIKGRAWGEVNFIEKFLGFKGIEPLALLDDFRLYFKNKNLFKKAALVTDKKYLSSLTRIFGPLTKVEIKVFPISNLMEARKWIGYGQGITSQA